MQRGAVRVETNIVVRLPIILAFTILFLGGGLGWFHKNAPDFIRNGIGGVLIPIAAISSAVGVTNLLLRFLTRKKT